MALTDKLTAIGNAIRAKTGRSSLIPLGDMPAEIANIPSGRVKEKTVNFYNYAGELLYSYTEEEVAELTELPEAPTIQGMTFQTWNWNLADIKSWVQNHDEGSLPVGAVFVTDDGHTRIYMHLREPRMASAEMPFCIQQIAGTVIIDWGDNSQPETITAAGVYSHLWQVNSYPADVMIDIEYIPSGSTKLVLGRVVESTTYGLFNNEPYYSSCVEKVEYGENTDMLAYSATFKNCSKLKSINIPSNFTSIGNYTFYGCTNLALTVLPDGITSIGDYAFYGCTNLALTVLPDGITSISSYAFYGCTNLALTVLPDGITSIGNYTFYGCTNLALIVLPDGITSIGNGAFQGCTNLALTVLPDGITSIGGSVFQGCTNLALTVLPDGITSISSYAFYGCTNLALIVLPDGITSISSYAFYGCTNLALIVLPDGITSIGGSVFQGCTNLALTVLPDGITSISSYAFYGCTNLALTVLPDGITSIGNGAFQNCTNLALTVLPDGITSIGGSVFQGCTSLYFIDLTAFTDPQAIPTLDNANAFQGIPATAQFAAKNQEMYDAFTTATNWSTYASRFQIEPRATNYITQAKDAIGGTALYNGTGYKQDYRWISDNTEDNVNIPGVPNKFAVGYIELEPGDVVHFYGDILKGISGSLFMHIQSSSNTRLVRATLSNWTDYTNRPDIMATMTDIDYDTTTNTLHSFRWTGGTNAVKGYMRLTCVGTFTEGVTVVTINDEM